MNQPDDNRLILTLDQQTDQSLVGRLAVFTNDGVQDAAYTIRGLRKAGRQYELSIGDSTLVRGYANPKNLSAGCVYNVRPNDPVRIPLSAYIEPYASR